VTQPSAPRPTSLLPAARFAREPRGQRRLAVGCGRRLSRREVDLPFEVFFVGQTCELVHEHQGVLRRDLEFLAARLALHVFVEPQQIVAQFLELGSVTLVGAAWALVVGRLCGAREVVVGAVRSGRPPELADVEAMVGMFVNTVPARFTLDEDASVADWLGRAQRASVRNVQIRSPKEPIALDGLQGKMDLVFVDAPCSGIGALRRNPEARWRLREADLAGFAARQREILTMAKDLCAPGGRVVYGTCTLLRIENQDVVEAVLAADPALAAVPLGEVLDPARALALGDGASFTVTPHRHGTDGFYARVLTRAR